jgi:S-adenosyl-L-methionine hydrolase (adenosine-forming)
MRSTSRFYAAPVFLYNSRMRPIVALLSDFGSQDHYVGAMKGAVLSVCPEAQLVDVVHDLPAHDVEAGSFTLAAAVDAFPPGTVFLAVVDPGVGTSRRGLAVQTRAHRFVAPDNGLLTLVLADHPSAAVHAITNAGLFRFEVSATFHGRDVFGPVAGHLARGMPIEEVGPVAKDPHRLPLPEVRRRGEHEWEGEVVHVDRFGNLTTNVSARDLEGILSHFDSDPTEVVVVVEGAILPLVRTYADVVEGEAGALLGSSRRLEVAIHGGNASRILGAARGAAVRIRRALSGSDRSGGL